MGFFDGFKDALGSVGSALSGVGSVFGAVTNMNTQKQYAQNGIQWRVEDAKKAGIHPLAALGAHTTSFTPISVGSELGDAMQRIGQNLSTHQQQKQQADAMQLQNTFNKKQIDKLDAEINYTNAKTSEIMTGIAHGQDLVSGSATQGLNPMQEKAIGSAVKNGVPLNLNQAVSKTDAMENAIPGFRLANVGNGRYQVEPSKDRADWLQDLAVANLGDAISYSFDKYSPTEYRQWNDRANALTRQAHKNGSLKKNEYFEPVFTLSGWSFQKRSMDFKKSRSFKRPTNFSFPNF